MLFLYREAYFNYNGHEKRKRKVPYVGEQKTGEQRKQIHAKRVAQGQR